MEVLNKEEMFCPDCMKIHEVLTVRVEETFTIHGSVVTIPVIYSFCPVSNKYWRDDE